MTNGSKSSFPLTRLAARYNQMQQDGRMLSNRAVIDAVDRRIMQLMDRVDVDEAPERLKRLSDLWRDYMSAKLSRATVDEMKLEKQIDVEFEKVYHDYEAWKQIFEAFELRGKSVEREVKILKEIKAIMTVEDGRELMAKALAAVMRVLEDNPKKMKQVQYEFSRIIGESSDDVIEGNGEEVGGDGETGGGEEGSGDVDQTKLLYPGDQE